MTTANDTAGLVEPIDLLRGMLANDIKRDGPHHSFMVRAGLLAKLLDELAARRLAASPPPTDELAAGLEGLCERLRELLAKGCDDLGIMLPSNDENVEVVLGRLLAVAVSRSASMDKINTRALRWREEAKLAQAEGVARLEAIRDWDLRDENNNPNVPEDFKGSPFDYLRKLANDGVRSLSSPPYSSFEAATALETLSARLVEARGVVEPFALIAETIEEVARADEDDGRIWVVQAYGCQLAELTEDHFRKAASWLAGEEG